MLIQKQAHGVCWEENLTNPISLKCCSLFLRGIIWSLSSRSVIFVTWKVNKGVGHQDGHLIIPIRIDIYFLMRCCCFCFLHFSNFIIPIRLQSLYQIVYEKILWRILHRRGCAHVDSEKFRINGLDLIPWNHNTSWGFTILFTRDNLTPLVKDQAQTEKWERNKGISSEWKAVSSEINEMNFSDDGRLDSQGMCGVSRHKPVATARQSSDPPKRAIENVTKSLSKQVKSK